MKYDTFLFAVVAVLCILLAASYLGAFKFTNRFFGKIMKKEPFTNSADKSTTVYTAPNGATATVKHGTITVTNPDGSTSVYTAASKGTGTKGAKETIYYGPNGGTATVVEGTGGGNAISIVGPDGGQAVEFSSSNGNVETATTNNTNSSNNNNGNNNGSSNTTYDNYNHFTGSSMPTVFYGPEGATARVIDTNGDQTLVVTTKNGTTEIYTIDNNGNDSSVTTYVGTDGRKAVVATDENGKYAVSLTAADGSKVMYYEDNVYTYNGETGETSQTNANSANNSYDSAFDTYYGPAGGSANVATGPAGNTAAVATGPEGNSAAVYNDSLPAGVPRSQIPAGQEDLYILKSEVVPPVCPACPDMVCPEPKFDETKCGPCPPCERVNTNQFECKKVPNYKADNSSILPIPVISDFSGFGM
jgi:hypothetical protein